jgi:hypothetical protein
VCCLCVLTHPTHPPTPTTTHPPPERQVPVHQVHHGQAVQAVLSTLPGGGNAAAASAQGAVVAAAAGVVGAVNTPTPPPAAAAAPPCWRAVAACAGWALLLQQWALLATAPMQRRPSPRRCDDDEATHSIVSFPPGCSLVPVARCTNASRPTPHAPHLTRVLPCVPDWSLGACHGSRDTQLRLVPFARSLLLFGRHCLLAAPGVLALRVTALQERLAAATPHCE